MDEPVPADELRRRLEDIRARIGRVAGDREVRIIAVTKGFDVAAPRAALTVGLSSLGENYAQELVAKDDALDESERASIHWHFIGRLQRNKVRLLAARVAVWQSVDRIELLDEIARRAPGATVFVQVDLSGEPQKGGAAPDAVPGLVDHARSLGLDVRGLMGVGPAGPPEGSRAGFRALVDLADRLELPERSIGMSHDLEVAVEEGATLVRVGTALFGARPPRPVSVD